MLEFLDKDLKIMISKLLLVISKIFSRQ
jgi:hypothetical protein